MVQQAELARSQVSRRVGAASLVELEYFCRTCKGHFASSVSAHSVRNATCRCGSNNLLVYSIAGVYGSPLRSR